MLQRIVQWFREFADHVDPPVDPILLLTPDEQVVWCEGYAACLYDINGYCATEAERLSTAQDHFLRRHRAADRRAVGRL